MAKPARQLTLAVETLLQFNGWLVWKNGASALRIGDRFVRTGTAGVPDLMACRGGQLLCVEIKAGKDRLSAAQSDWLLKAKQHGAIVIVAHHIEDVSTYLESDKTK